MTNEQPQVSLEGRYSITETASKLGIHRHSLQKYTENGLIKCGYRKATGRKFYLGSEIIKFWRKEA